MAPAWRIYYADGSTFSSYDGEPWQAPKVGAQVVLKTDPDVGRFLFAARDFYWFDHERGEWFGGDQAGFYQHLMANAPSCVVFGTNVKTREYHDCILAALRDTDFPPKSARHELEFW